MTSWPTRPHSQRTPGTTTAVALDLGTDPLRGLGSAEADARLERDGSNELASPRGPAYGRIAARQLVEPLVGLLVAAALVSAAIGETVEAAAIGLIVVLNATFGFAQEYRAERAVARPAGHGAGPVATVMRDGEELQVAGARRRAGRRGPAAGRGPRSGGCPGDRVASVCEADESPLTGESARSPSTAQHLADAGARSADRRNMVYAGTVATYGRGSAMVVATGSATEHGADRRHAADAVESAAHAAAGEPRPRRAPAGAWPPWSLVSW